MLYLEYESCKADPDLWVKKFHKPSGEPYYGLLLLYVDDCLYINMDAISELEKLDSYFSMKPGSIGDPDIYLGGKLTTATMVDPNTGLSCEAWGLSPTKYVQASIDNI